MYNISVISSFGLDVSFETEKFCELYVDMVPTTPKECVRILWVMEPNEISNMRNNIIENHKKFDLILTWDKYILESCPNSKLFPYGTSWVSDFDLNIKKEYCITSVVGGKLYTSNHHLRQKLPSIVEEITSIPLHLFNSKNNPYNGEFKIDRIMSSNSWIKNELFYSQFHIVIENVSSENYFTEKLIDCFQTKTVPIYLGCPNIGSFFDVDGLLVVNSVDDIKNICNSINDKTYDSMLESINFNYEKSLQYSDFRNRIKDEVTLFINTFK